MQQRVVLADILSIIALLGMLPAGAGMTVPLAWNASTDPTVVGYKLYYGTAPNSLTNSVSVGSVTSVAITGLAEGVTYYFAAAAYNATGLQSPLSNEVTYTIPVSSTLAIQALTANGQPSVNITSLGALPDQWTLMASSNLKKWTPVAQGSGGAVNIIVPTGASPVQFFQLIGQ